MVSGVNSLARCIHWRLIRYKYTTIIILVGWVAPLVYIADIIIVHTTELSLLCPLCNLALSLSALYLYTCICFVVLCFAWSVQ